jgi:polar amino acid transport system substrate-binding protein
MMTRTMLTALILGLWGGSLRAQEAPLRVGVTPDYPPLIYAAPDGGYDGLEIDLAFALADRLGRKLEFVELKWADQIAALLEGRTDIIMSGMSATPARRVRIEFSDPYLETGLLALIRRKDAQKFKAPEDLVHHMARLGFQKGATAQAYVQGQLSNTTSRAFMTPDDGALEVQRKRIDAFVHDGPGAGWLASKYDADLTVILTPLSRERLAWGVRRGDEALLKELNQTLAAWKDDGSLDRMLNRWLPYHEKMKAALKQSDFPPPDRLQAPE